MQILDKKPTPEVAGFQPVPMLTALTIPNGPTDPTQALLQQVIALQQQVHHDQQIIQALNSYVGVSVTDATGQITYANERFCALSGYRAEELLGNTHRILNSQYHDADFFQNLKATICAGNLWKGEMRNRTKNGTFYWVEMVIMPTVATDGRVTGYVSISTDITAFRENQYPVEQLLLEAREKNEELQASEEELRQTLEYALEVGDKIADREAKYRLISDSMGDMICLHQLSGDFSYVSPSVTTLLGYSPEELLGTSPAALIHPGDPYWLGSASGGENQVQHYVQYRIRKRNGRYVWFETLTQPILNEKGQLEQWHTASRDITSRKQAEAERDNFFNHSLDVMVIASLDGSIRRVNAAWEDNLASPMSSAGASNIFDFVHPKDVGLTKAVFGETIAQQKGNFSLENRCRCQDGSYKWIAWNYVLFAEEGIFYGFGRDITEKKLAEESLKNTLEELRQRNHELDHYVYRVSHDLRAPLCSIEGLTSLIETESDLTEIKYYARLITERVRKSDAFIQSILSHSRTLNSPLNITEVDLATLIEEAFSEVQYLPGADRLRKQVEVATKAPFYTDAFRLSTVLKNFLSNAVKYLNPSVSENYVCFTIHISSFEAHIRIEDNGIGIDTQYLPQLFDMFFRATDRSNGNGLGLYIVKQTLERLGGQVTVTSELGRGTTFDLHLRNLNPAGTR